MNSSIAAGATACVLPFIPTAGHQGCSCNRDQLSRSQAHPGAQGMIRLRPHHLLCTQGYSGKGL